MSAGSAMAQLSRRGFLAGVGATAAATLTGCTSFVGGGQQTGGSSSDEPLTFWNMPNGGDTFLPEDRAIVEGYRPAEGLPEVTYQQVPWNNYLAVFASALASGTGPAVSGGGSTQPFLYDKDGSIAHADGLVARWEQDGLAADFLPGLLDAMRTPNGYAAVPYNLDFRVLWFNKALLERAGAQPPTDWQSYLDAAEALKRIGVFGYGTGANGNTGAQALLGLMINNGGGLFDENYQPNFLTPQNIEAMEFVQELARKGYVDPGSVAYTSSNARDQWQAGAFGLGFEGSALDTFVTGEQAQNVAVASPLRGPSGSTGTVYFPNPIMMFRDTPDQAGSEAFVDYYYRNMASLWTKKTGIGLPPLRSIAQTPEFAASTNQVKIIDEWQPVARTLAAPGNTALFPGASTVDGTPAMLAFAQAIVGLRTDARTALRDFEQATKDALTQLGR